MIEATRIKTLKALELVGTRATGAFFNLAEMAATFYGAPYAGITLIDHDTRWFFASVGMAPAKTARANCCCEHVISGLESVVFDDLATARAKGLIIESDFPEWRFYAGAPIVLGGGEAIGALFVAGDAPRKLDRREEHALVGLASLAVESFRFHESLLAQQKSALEIYAQAERLERANNDLQQAREDVDFASQVAKIGFWSKAPNESRIVLSPSLCEILEINNTASISEEAFCSVFEPEFGAELKDKIVGAMMDERAIDINLLLDNRGGADPKWVRLTGRSSRDDAGIRRVYGCIQDVTEVIESRSKVSKIAMRDTLTGAYNRRFLPFLFGKKRKACAADERLIAMTIDLDNFKLVNDTQGHDTGDTVLVEVTRVLRGELRSDDVLARLGGDEFFILASTRCDVDGGAALGERLRERAAANSFLSGFANPVTFSIGYCDATDGDLDFEHVLKCSDLAVFEAKRGGRNRSVLYETEMGVANSRRKATLDGIEAALARGEIIPYYQPMVRLADRRVIGVEVLARWRRADGEVLSPAQFADALGDVVYGERISREVTECAARQLGELKRQGASFGRMAVNVTETQMLGSGFEHWLRDVCDESGLAINELEIEITERCLLTRSPDLLRANLSALSELGVTVAFDDFGAGFASLTHLLSFAIDVIKIDQSFIQNFTTDEKALGVTRSIVNLGKNLGQLVVAEGVETFEAEAMLKNMGCDAAQGYLYSKPVEFARFAEFLGQGVPSLALADIHAEATRESCGATMLKSA